MLTAENGRLITDVEEIKEDILDFYRMLLGSRTAALQGVDLNVIRGGKRLSVQAKECLMRGVTHVEIEEALAGIGSDKAP